MAYEGNDNVFWAYSCSGCTYSQPENTAVIQASIGGYSNGTSQLTFSYQHNAEWGTNYYAAQDVLMVNPPGASGDSQMWVQIWSPTSSCSSSNPWSYDFNIGYTSDFTSSGYWIEQYYTQNSSGNMLTANIYLYTSGGGYVDNWAVNIPTNCQYYLDQWSLNIVGYATVNNNVQDFCMTSGNGYINYNSNQEEGANTLTAENSNVAYTANGVTNQQDFNYTTLLPNC